MNTYCKFRGQVVDADNPTIKLEFDSNESDGEKRGRHLIREIKKLQEIVRNGETPTRHDYPRYRPFIDADTKRFEIPIWENNKVVLI
jgi:hypothetical protein